MFRLPTTRALGVMAATLLLASTATAAPVTIDFEGVAPPGGDVVPVTPYFEDGFLLTTTPSPAPEGIFAFDAPINSNGTDVFGWCATGCMAAPLVVSLERDGGGRFDLAAFGHANLIPGDPRSADLVITGHRGPGQAVVDTITVGPGWQTASLAGFTGLTRVDFVAAGVDLTYLSFDDLAVEAVLTEPVTAPAVAFGLLAFAAARRWRPVSPGERR